MHNRNLIYTCFLALSFIGISILTENVLSAENGPQITESEYHNQAFLSRIKIESLWNLTLKNSLENKVKVLVCDTGIESKHPLLDSVIELPGINAVDGSQNTEPSGHGHGTRMAGIINVMANNKKDLVRILPGKISNESNGRAEHSNTSKCIRWAADQGIRIVNLSYSGAINNPDIIEAAQYLHDHNGILVISAGDVSGETKDYPDNTNMIVVGYVSSANFIMSTRGPYVDLVAPGTSIISTNLGGALTNKFHGSSEAVAVVSGAASLILSIKPELTATKLSEILLNSTDDLLNPGRDIYSGHGLLNLEKAVSFMKN